ncbi:MAG: Uma2 family endonuclease [Alphaproteobacteria bacterium]|jgi:Uma2 family endonuclease|nr:Uma2 family endonuclease [Alphaproteobacteria bacterium]
MSVNAVLDRPMTVAEFLDWQPPDGRRYQLVDGRPVAMAPGSDAHGTLVSALTREIGNHLKGQGRCRVVNEAGIVPPNQDRSYFVADIAVTCVPHKRGRLHTALPILIIEVLSPGTEAEDRQLKVPAYRSMPSVREIVLVAQDRPAATILRQIDDTIWLAEEVSGLDGLLRLESLDCDLPFAEIYAGLDIDDVRET